MKQTEDSPIVKDEQEMLLRVAQVYLSCQLDRNTPSPNPIITLFWEEFHRFYTPIVLKMVRRFCPDLALADDIAQEVWVIIAKKLPEFHWKRDGGDLCAWIGKIVHDKAVDFLRRKRTLPNPSPLDFSSEAQHLYELEEKDFAG